MTNHDPLSSWYTCGQCCTLDSVRKSTGEQWQASKRGSSKDQCHLGLAPNTRRHRPQVENTRSAVWAPEDQMVSWWPGGMSPPSTWVSRIPRLDPAPPPEVRPPSTGRKQAAPTLYLAWVFFSKRHVPVLTTSTQWEKRQHILEIWNSHFCSSTGENSPWTLRVKLKHQDNSSLSFGLLDMPECCHQNCKLNFQLAVSLRGPLLHVYSED